MVDGLVEQNHAADVVRQLRIGGEQQLPVDTAVLLAVLDADRGETFADRACVRRSGLRDFD